MGKLGGGVSGGGGWEARGGLYLPIGLFGASMSPRSASYRSSVSVVTSHGRQNQL